MKQKYLVTGVALKITFFFFTCDLRSLTLFWNATSSVLRPINSSSYWAAPANKRARIFPQVSIRNFQSLEVLVSISLILLSSSVTLLPLKILIFLTSSKAWINDSSSTAPAWPAVRKKNSKLDIINWIFWIYNFQKLLKQKYFPWVFLYHVGKR